MTERNVLVTGATGFLGGAVCRLLVRRGWRVTATGRNEAAGHTLTRTGIPFRRASLEHAPETIGLCDGQRAVVHCAARSSPWGTWREFHAANVCATENILHAARESRVERFVHISTPSVYFDFRHRLALTETSPLPARPANAYAATKLAAEHFVLAAAHTGLPVVVLRPRAIFGPGDTTIFPRLLRAAKAGRLPVIGDGRNVADLTCIDNAALAVACALEAPADCHGHVFNVTNGEPVVLWEFIATLLGQLGLPAPRRRLPVRAALLLAALAEGVGRLRNREPSLTRYGVGVLAYSQTFDISRAHAMLGYQPTVSTAEGARRLVAHLRQSPEFAA